MLLRRLGSARPRPVTARRARRSRSDGECAAPSPPRPGLRAAGAQRSRRSRDPFPPASSGLRLPGPSRPPPHLHPALPGRDPGPPPRPRPRPGPLNRVCTLGSPPRAACASQSPGLLHLCLCACTPLSLWVLSSRCPSSLGFLRCLLFSRLGSLVTSLSSWMRSFYPRSTCAPGLGSCPVCATSLWGLCHLSACTSPDRSSCPLPANPGSGPVPSRSAPVCVEVLVPSPPLTLQVWGSALSACTLGSGPCPFPSALLRSSPVSLRLLSQLCSEPRPDLGPGVGMAFQ